MEITILCDQNTCKSNEAGKCLHLSPTVFLSPIIQNCTSKEIKIYIPEPIIKPIIKKLKEYCVWHGWFKENGSAIHKCYCQKRHEAVENAYECVGPDCGGYYLTINEKDDEII
jgi:hypothetical protein